MTKKFAILPNSHLNLLGIFVDEHALAMLQTIFEISLIIITRCEHKSTMPILFVMLIVSLIRRAVRPLELPLPMHLTEFPVSGIPTFIGEDNFTVAVGKEFISIDVPGIYSSIRILYHTWLSFFLYIDFYFLFLSCL